MHHFASWFVMRGGSLPALLGHADLKMTLRYAHLAPHYLGDEIARTERPAQAAAQITQAITHEPVAEVAAAEALTPRCSWCRSGDSNPDTLAGTRP